MQDNTNQTADDLWQNFEKTGSVISYLKYKGVTPENTTTDKGGEAVGDSRNRRYSNKRN